MKGVINWQSFIFVKNIIAITCSTAHIAENVVGNTAMKTNNNSAPKDKEPASCGQRKKREPPTTSICKYCGKTFVVNMYKILEGKGNYCSKPCQHLASRKGKLFNCERCGKPFYSTYKRKEFQGRGKYCSKKCFYGTLSIKCDYCGKDITKAPSLFEGRNKHFCGNNCFSMSLVKYPKEIRKLVNREKGIWKIHYGTVSITNQKSKSLLALSQLATRVLSGKIAKSDIPVIISKIHKGETYAAYE